jgi:FtsP/CotA-like multicopper oxidase with cupredoxin domain
MTTTSPTPDPPLARPRRRRRWRRRLAIAGGVLASLAVVLVLAASWSYSRARMSNVGELSFENALQIPELLEPTVTDGGVQRFELDVQAGTTDFGGGFDTATWGVNGSYLGPTLRASAGDRVEIAVTNDVDEVTSMHWHGMHLPAAMDGGPHQPIEPGSTWTPTWEIDQPAASLWYHPHVHGATAEHVYRGAAGMFLIEDEASAELELPDEYGANDIPLIIQDKRFSDDGSLSFDTPFLASLGVLGEDILVNGTYDPHLDVAHERIRFRVLNASNARTYNLGFSDERSFQLIATDSGLLDRPATLDRLPLSPGERAEIVVRFAPGDEVVLRSFQPDLGGLDFWNNRFNGGDDTFDLVQFRAADRLESSPTVPDVLVDQDLHDPSEVVSTRSFRLSGTSINGRDMDLSRIDEVVTVDTTEIWEIEGGGMPHNFHPHDVRFRILDIDGRPPPPHLAGWKDTVPVLPGTTVRIILHFSDYTDPANPYMLHCHVLLHEDRGMMGQFVVVEPGQAPESPPGHAEH